MHKHMATQENVHGILLNWVTQWQWQVSGTRGSVMGCDFRYVLSSIGSFSSLMLYWSLFKPSGWVSELPDILFQSTCFLIKSLQGWVLVFWVFCNQELSQVVLEGLFSGKGLLRGRVKYVRTMGASARTKGFPPEGWNVQKDDPRDTSALSRNQEDWVLVSCQMRHYMLSAALAMLILHLKWINTKLFQNPLGWIKISW